MKFEFTFSNPSEQPVVVASPLVEKFLYLQDFLSDEKLGSHPLNAPFSEPSQQDEESVLTVPVGDKISRYIFLKVLEFATHHQGDPVIPEEAEKIFRKSLELDSWDEQFCNVDQKTLYDLILVTDNKQNGATMYFCMSFNRQPIS
jgi:hypothetical protein